MKHESASRQVNAIRFFLHQYDYPGKDKDVVFPADSKIVRRGREAVGD